MEKNESFSVFLMVALLAFAVVLVDERLLRTGMAVLPALWLAQRALERSTPPPPEPGDTADRRTDDEVRVHIERLLKYFREFYTTCHLLGTRVISAEAAEERAHILEKELNRLLAEVTQVAKTRAHPPR